MTHADRLAALFADLERLDFDAVAARCAPDCVYEDVPYADATVTGPEAIRAKLALGLASLERLPTTIHELLERGDTVLVERTEVWHHPSGERATLRVAAVFKFRGDRLVLWRDYWDARTLLDQQPAAWLPMIPRLVEKVLVSETGAKDATRGLSTDAAKSLAPGAAHYTAFVGPPEQFDFMGATQFRLLCALGLRERHRLLDLGCGSLRAGRLLIPYLARGHYHGLEPNRWLIEDAIEREIGQDLIRLKQPKFLHHEGFGCREFGTRFDFVLAQSILSHCGRDLAPRVLAEIAAGLDEGGIAASTFVVAGAGQHADERGGWIYPGVVAHTADTIERWIAGAGLFGRAIPWWHPRQTWYVLAKRADRIPHESHDALLRGAVLFDAELAPSLD